MKNITLLTIIIIFYSNILFSQDKDSLFFDFGDKMQVFKNIPSNTFSLKKGNNLKYKNLKFVLPLWEYIQVLDKNNLKFYIDKNGKKQKKTKIKLELCGTVPNYNCEIIEKNDKYIITIDETFYDSKNLVKAEVIDSISKREVDKIYFSNNSQKINYDENDFVFNFTKTFPFTAIIEKDNQKGILNNGKVIFFDEIISTKNWIFKIRVNNKIGFYQITETKYTELENFNFGLAKFKLENGKTGYVDVKGKEYYD